MARNVKHAGKVDGAAAIKGGEPFGETFQKSTTHAPELRKGVSEGKTSGKIKSNGVISQAAGPTMTCNDPAVEFPSLPGKERESKIIAESATKGAKPPKTGGDPVDGGGRKGTGLKSSYDKSGRTDRTSQSFR